MLCVKKNVNYKNICRGMYKIAFSVCIVILCVITVIITENYEKAATTELKIQEEETIAEPVDAKETEKENTKISDASSVIADVLESPVNENAGTQYEPEFIMPVNGDIAKDFSLNIPLYNKTMDDWRIHTGIDILCPYGSEILSCEKGTVTDVGYDMLYGNYVEVTINDFTLKYTSLDSQVTYSVGNDVNKGDIIGYLSDSCVVEICDEPHLHFEMKKSGQYVDPRDYIN